MLHLNWTPVAPTGTATGAATAVVGHVPSAISVDSETELAEPGSIELTPGRMPRVVFEDVEAFVREQLLIDARSHARYAGETEPIDPAAGHIPGARSLPTTENIDADGYFLPPPRCASSSRRSG